MKNQFFKYFVLSIIGASAWATSSEARTVVTKATYARYFSVRGTHKQFTEEAQRVNEILADHGISVQVLDVTSKSHFIEETFAITLDVQGVDCPQSKLKRDLIVKNLTYLTPLISALSIEVIATYENGVQRILIPQCL